MINRYLRERGDANIKSNADLISKATFYQDPNFPDRKQARENAERATELDTVGAAAEPLRAADDRCCSACRSSGSTRSSLRRPRCRRASSTAPREPGERPAADRLVAARPAGLPGDHRAGGLHDRSLGSRARRRRARAWSARSPARLPVGVDFIGRPFDEPTAVPDRVGVRGRDQAPHAAGDFGPLPGEP